MYRKLVVTVCILLEAAFCCYGTGKNDSIQVLLASQKTIPSKVALLNAYAAKTVNSDPAAALEYYYQALTLLQTAALAEEYDSLHLENLYTLGLYYSRMQLNDSVIYIQGKVFDAAREKYRQLAARAVNERAISFESLGNYKQALTDYLQALNIYEDINDNRGVMHELMNIGLIYQYQKKYTDAVGLYNRAIQIGQKINDHDGVTGTYNNLAIVYQEQKQYHKALTYFKKVLEFDLMQGDSSNIADSYNNIGVVLHGLLKYDEALAYYHKSLGIKKALDDYEGYANTCNNVASLYLDKKSPETINWLSKASEIGITHKLNGIMLENYRIARLYYTSQQDYKKAMEFTELYYVLQDSMKLAELQLQTENVQKQYELEKRSKELAIKDAEISEREYKEWIYLLLAGLAAGVALYLYYSMRRARVVNRQLRLHKEKIVKINDDLVQKNQEAEKARKQAEEAIKAKAQFLSVMSHEIKTPLNAIIGISNLLDENEPRPDQKENINMLQRSSGNLLTLLNDILAYNEIEAGKVKPDLVVFDPEKITIRLAELFKPKAHKKGIAFDFKYDERIPARLTGDSFHLNQILMNLLSNAVKFTNTGKVTFEVKMNSLNETECILRFIIQDTGIGIPQHKMNTIFDAFTQVDLKSTRQFGGTGLGLSISKKLLAMFDTELKVKSEINAGSEFSFNIALKPGAEEEDISPVTDKPKSADDLKGKHILVVEDNAVNVFVIRQFLMKWNAEVAVAENGELAIMKCNERDYDAILMDLHMPVVDGFEATRQILAKKPSAKIIAITATHEEEVRDQIKEAGMVDLVLKPFKPDDLLNKIKSVLV